MQAEVNVYFAPELSQHGSYLGGGGLGDGGRGGRGDGGLLLKGGRGEGLVTNGGRA